MGIKERRTKILVTLFFLGDLRFAPVELTEDVQKVFDISLNPKTKSTLRTMQKHGVIEKVTNVTDDTDSSKSNDYKLTSEGYNELCLVFPYCRFIKYEWDGKWRILSYEIPEKKREMRDRLRREVSAWGLGPWHRSFWITPHPIVPNLKSLVSNKEEEKYIQAFDAEHVFGNREVLIEKVWETKSLEADYRKLFKKWHDTLSSDKTQVEKLKIVITEYVNVLRKDAGLPPQLVGDNWIGFESFKIFKEIRTILLKK